MAYTADQIKKILQPSFDAKADKTTVDSSLAGKADISSVTAISTAIGLTTSSTLVAEPIALGSAGILHSSSTFSGWGNPIGNPKNFNKLTFKVGARQNISLIKVVIRSVNKTGTILASKDVVVNIVSGDTQLVTVLFDSTILNTGGDQLYFMFAADGYVTDYGVSGVTNPYPYPTYAPSSYTTSGNLNFATFSVFSDPNVCQFLYLKIELETKSTGAIMPTAEIALPSRIFALEGKETNIYFADIVFSNLKLNQLDFDITCAKGAQFDKFYRVTPVSADAGNYPFTIDVYFAGTKIATATATLYISASNAGTGITRSVLGIGDSTLSSGQPQSIIITENASGVMGINFKGTQGSGSNKHEGRGGWSIASFTTSGSPFYKFVLSGVITPPAILSIYTDGTNQFDIREINLTSGSGYVSGYRSSGAGTPPASGTLTKVSGTGDATLNYSSFSIVASNPFWNNTSGALDFANYLTTNSISLTANDWVYIHLGINDVITYTDDALLATQINTMVTQLRALITNIRSAVTGIRIALCITIMPSISQDAMGANYTSGQTLSRYILNLKAWQKRMISEFDNSAERTAENYLIPWNSILDRENNMQKATMNANARNTEQITTYTNGVHPAQGGYDQMGDQLFAFLKYMA